MEPVPEDAVAPGWPGELDVVRIAMASLPDVSLLIFDGELRYRAVVGGALERHGYVPANLIGRRLHDVVPARALATLEPRYRAALRGEEIRTVIASLDGLAVYETTFGPLRVDGRAVGGMALARAIPPQDRVQAELSNALELVERSFADAPIGIALVGLDGRWLRVNRALCELLGRSEEELYAISFQDVTHPADLDEDLALGAEILSGRRSSFQVEKRYIRADGTVVWAALSVALVRHADGTPRWFVSHVEDITPRKLVEAELRHRARHDPLTGLLNRRGMTEEIERFIVDGHAPGEPAALLLVDLDGFKRVNDRLGHDVGDRHLRAVADALRAAVRATDLCGRMGGDEFVVLMPGSGARDAMLVADRVVELVAAGAADRVAPGAVRASVGVATLRPG